MAWSKERMRNNIKTKHPWLTQEQINEYMGLPGAYERRAFIKSLEYWRKKNV